MTNRFNADHSHDKLKNEVPMTKDAFGHPVEFGTVIRVGKIRKDGKYPVAFIFKSTGRRINAILTKEKLEKLEVRTGSEALGGPLTLKRLIPIAGPYSGLIGHQKTVRSDGLLEVVFPPGTFTAWGGVASRGVFDPRWVRRVRQQPDGMERIRDLSVPRDLSETEVGE
jgi:hypothetical protein